MRGLSLLCFVVILPVLGVLGHDVWHAYNDKHGLDFTKAFPFSDTGWLWTHYARPSYDWARGTIPAPVWKQYVAPVLETRAIIVAAVPAAVVYGILAFFKLFGIGPFSGQGVFISRMPGSGRRGGKYAFNDLGPQKTKFKYKRK